MESLRKQTYKNIKVYIHDDGSSDKTLDIIKEYVEHKRGTIEFELFSKKSLRYPMCFINTLLEIPKADYYAFCDQDDVWNEDKIRHPDRLLCLVIAPEAKTKPCKPPHALKGHHIQ